MDSEQKSAVTRAPGDSRDNGKNGKRVFLKCIKMHILLLTDEQVCFIIETIQGNQGAKNLLTQHHSIGNNKIHHMQI